MYIPTTLLYGVGMISMARGDKATWRLMLDFMSPEVPTDRALIGGLYSRRFRAFAAAPSTGSQQPTLIHNLASSPFWDETLLHRMPERQPSRESICACTVAVLVDQKGER